MENNSLKECEYFNQIQTIFAHSSDCLIVIDEEGAITYLNTSAERFFKVMSIKMEGRPIQKLIPGFDQENIPHSTMSRFTGVNGKGELSIQVMANPLQVGSKWYDVLRIKCVEENGNDTIQELVSVNKELADLKWALDESSIIAITDQSGIIQAVNKKFCELSKYKEEELIGKDHKILNSGYHPKSFFRDMWKTIGSGQVWRGEILNKTKIGTLYWVHTTIVPILNEKGKPYRYISFRVDITERKQMETALRDSLRKDFNQTVKNLENGIFKMIQDERGNCVYVMAEGKLMEELGIGTGKLEGRTPFDAFPEHIASYKNKKYKKAFQGNHISYEVQLSGRLLYVDVSPIRQGETVAELVGSVHDVTELRSTQKQLQENKSLYQSLFKHSQDVVFSLDAKGVIQQMNPAAEMKLGLLFEKTQTKSLLDMIAPKDQALAHGCFKKTLWGELQNFDAEVRHLNGDRVYFNFTFLPIIVDQQVAGIYSIGKDISERIKVQELNEYLAHHDELTKLLNRRGFEAVLKNSLVHAEENQKCLAVMYIDLDRFKNINDTLGHFIGDCLLEQIAVRLSGSIREGTYIARMGGDEFMVLCPGIQSSEETIQFANEYLNRLKEPFFIKGHELYVTASIGISTFPSDGLNVVDLMRRADVALYRAKDLGRNNCQIYSSSMDATSYQSFFMERDLRKALIHDEFTAYFQPRVDARTNKIISAEALIRWNHPKYGLVPPSEFIPLAEETGLIIPIGEWMKKRVCEQLVKWREAGIPLVPISINVSPQRFLQSDFANCVRQILEKYDLNGSLLEIEITENSLMRTEEYVGQTIEELKELGVKIYIDDFGTGYSSFAYLKSFKLDGIKIDRSFIKDISSESENASITSAMINLAKHLKMDVIAEGVETVEELNFLKEHNCHHVQGYLFAKPGRAEEFQALLAEGLNLK